jgi:hypothetical protein
MSRYQPYDCKTITNQDVLLSARAELGFGPGTVEIHAQPQPLIDWVGHQTHYLSGKADVPDVAHLIIRRKHVGGASNDIGLLRQVDGSYKVIVSEHDIHARYGPKNETFSKALERAYIGIQADTALSTVLNEAVPRLRAEGKLKLGDTIVRRDVGTKSQLVKVSA